jgi:hypothetical protein
MPYPTASPTTPGVTARGVAVTTKSGAARRTHSPTLPNTGTGRDRGRRTTAPTQRGAPIRSAIRQYAAPRNPQPTTANVTEPPITASPLLAAPFSPKVHAALAHAIGSAPRLRHHAFATTPSPPRLRPLSAPDRAAPAPSKPHRARPPPGARPRRTREAHRALPPSRCTAPRSGVPWLPHCGIPPHGVPVPQRSAFIAPPSSHRLHRSAFIARPSSLGLHRSAFIARPSSHRLQRSAFIALSEFTSRHTSSDSSNPLQIMTIAFQLHPPNAGRPE